MKKKAGRIALKAYIKEHVRVAAAFLLSYLILALVFYLYGFPVTSVLYGLLLSLLPMSALSLFDFVRYRVRYLTLLQHKESLQKGILTLPPAGTLIERELITDFNGLYATLRERDSETDRQKSETESYYTLWVHQIKTPISAMRLILESDKSREGQLLKQELFKVERYVEMVLSYLRLSSIHSDLSLASYRIYDIARQAVKKYSATFIFRHISLVFEPFDNAVVTDEKWLLLAIEQVLSNALKYTDPGGTVTIEMDETDALYIRDTGIGIPPEDLPRIFERGYTGYNGRMNKTSTGLGLFLAKKTLDMLGNTISVFSEPEQGTTVKIALHKKSFFME